VRPRFPAPALLALAAFLFAGDMKADPVLARLPVDLTLLTAGILSLFLLARWLRGARAVHGPGLGAVALWFLTFLPGILAAAPTEYGARKVATLCTFSLLAALAPFLLVRSEEDVDGILDALALPCALITLDALAGAGQGLQRLAGFGGGTIALGRAAGFLALWACLAFARTGRILQLVPAGAGAVAALFSGSRGPLAGLLVGLVLGLVGPRLAGPRLAARGRLLAAAGGALLAVNLCLALGPSGSLRRVQAFVQGEYGASEAYRASAARAAWEHIQVAPFGIGLGGFATRVDLDAGVDRQYPHDLLLETALESGWASGVATLGILAAALARAWRTGQGALAAALGFWVLNALVSGDLNDNRALLALLSTALALPGGRP